MTVLETARVLAECTRELTCLTDGEGLVVAAAGPWEQAAGVAAGEVSGRLVDALVHEDDRAEFRACREAVAAGIVAGPLDVRLAASVWRIYDVELRRADGHVAVSLRDVTEQRRVEDRLNELNDRLTRTNAELQRSNDELQRFAYVASHDLSEPLRMVTSYCALLVNDFGDQLGDDAKEYLHYATDGALRMRALIDDLLAYSRVSWVAEEAVPVDLHAVVTDAVRDLGTVIADTGALVTVGPMPSVLGNAGQLGQLVANLLGNALKFRTEGTVPRVAVTARATGAQVTLTVADNGIGIDEKHRERIFVMFKRLHGRAAYEGNGIGLALCKRIAELHGGTVWAEEAPGGGSAFHVTLVGAGVGVGAAGAARVVELPR